MVGKLTNGGGFYPYGSFWSKAEGFEIRHGAKREEKWC